MSSAETIFEGWSDLRGVVTLVVAVVLFLMPWGGTSLNPMSAKRYNSFIAAARESRLGWWVSGNQTLLSIVELLLSLAVAITFSFYILLGPSEGEDDTADSTLSIWIASVAVAFSTGVWHKFTAWLFYGQRRIGIAAFMHILTILLVLAWLILTIVHYTRISEAEDTARPELANVSLALFFILIGLFIYYIFVTALRYFGFWSVMSVVYGGNGDGDDEDFVYTGGNAGKNGKAAAHLASHRQ